MWILSVDANYVYQNQRNSQEGSDVAQSNLSNYDPYLISRVTMLS